jgi:hypothetical protein
MFPDQNPQHPPISKAEANAIRDAVNNSKDASSKSEASKSKDKRERLR